MKTQITESIENQIVKMKNNLKFAQHFEVVCKAQQQKEQFSFTSLGLDDIKLFEETIFDFSGLTLRKYKVKHFEEMYELQFDKKIDNTKWIEVIKSIKYVLKNIDLDGNKSIAYDIADELFK